jgi:hypothetical protein
MVSVREHVDHDCLNRLVTLGCEQGDVPACGGRIATHKEKSISLGSSQNLHGLPTKTRTRRVSDHEISRGNTESFD